MAKQYRTFDQMMASFFDKEATYNAGPGGWTSSSAAQLTDFGDAFVAWEDTLANDQDTIHGSEYPTTDEIAHQDVRLVYSEPRVRPLTLAGFCATAGGTVVSVQDGALAAYRHKITPVATASQPPSIGIQEKTSGEQYKYHGIKVDRLTLRRGGPSRAWFSLEAGLIGSGHRATAADALPAIVSQTPLRWTNAKCWIESGTDISISATPVQGAEDISSATPDALTSRLLDVEISLNNALLSGDESYVPGSGSQRGELDHGNRSATVRLTLFVDETTLAAERAYYTGRENMAFELDVDSGTIIAATGAMKYGFDFIVPRMRLMPVGRGTSEGRNTLTLEGLAFDDGTNPLWQMYVYTEQAAFLA